MTDKVIRVNVTASKSQKVTVSSSKVANEITASPDTSAYYSRLAKNWAIAEGLVENIDYSSKHYAQESKASADRSKTYETATQENYNLFLQNVGDSIQNVQNTRDEALESIETCKNKSIVEVENRKTEAVAEVENVKTQAVITVQTTSNNAVNTINKEIEDGKKELKESVEDIKILTTLEIGDIGIAPLGIDETKGKRRYLNGQLIIQDQYVQFTNKVKSAVALYPSLACTEEKWQTTATMTVGGQVGKFVIDDEGGTIRLPKIIMPIQGLTDLSKLGEIVEAGLPNITGTFAVDSIDIKLVNGSFSGAFSTTATYGFNLNSNGNSGNTIYNANFNASKSNPTYGNSNTVQQEQIQYPYFIQVATGAETEDNIINEIELNNPFSLLDYKYSEYELNNLSWLRSNGQWNAKAIYPAVYDLLLKIYNGVETKAGVSVKLSTEDYTDYDFVLNTTEETFRLPIKVKLASGKAVVGNGKALGLTPDGTNIYTSMVSTTDGNNRVFKFGALSQTPTNIGTSVNVDTAGTTGVAIGVSSNPTLSGIETNDSGLYLYFYVGETVQNANLINAGRIEEKIASLIPDNSSLISGFGMPTGRYIDLTLGASGSSYTAPANGWVTINKSGTGAGQILELTCRVAIKVYTTASNQNLQLFIPVQKGANFRVDYTLAGATHSFRFHYAEGEQ